MNDGSGLLIQMVQAHCGAKEDYIGTERYQKMVAYIVN